MTDSVETKLNPHSVDQVNECIPEKKCDNLSVLYRVYTDNARFGLFVAKSIADPDRWTISMTDWRDRDTDSEIEIGDTFQNSLQTGIENCQYD